MDLIQWIVQMQEMLQLIKIKFIIATRVFCYIKQKFQKLKITE